MSHYDTSTTATTTSDIYYNLDSRVSYIENEILEFKLKGKNFKTGIKNATAKIRLVIKDSL